MEAARTGHRMPSIEKGWTSSQLGHTEGGINIEMALVSYECARLYLQWAVKCCYFSAPSVAAQSPPSTPKRFPRDVGYVQLVLKAT